MTAQGTLLVSIVLPTYKRAHVLPLAIRSVLAQTYLNWELIVVSDNSPDNTEAVVKSFDDPRIRYFRNDPNLKLPRTLNRGFSLAKGDFLTWTSDDNMLAPDAIARMVDSLTGGEADFVFADYYEFADTDAEGNPLDMRQVRLPDSPDLAKSNSIGACFLYTRELYIGIGEYDPDLFLNEDYDYWMRIARQFRMKHIAEPLYYFRRDEDSLYCSRFSEVRAGSLLVRYKNRYIDAEKVLAGIVDLIMANLDRHNHSLVRKAYLTCKGASFRLTKIYEWIARRMITCYLRPAIRHTLSDYVDGNKTFNDTRSALRDLMNRAAVIEYRSYVRPTIASSQES
jgi:glycosyltransferase involved in cell wall biosynthesis